MAKALTPITLAMMGGVGGGAAQITRATLSIDFIDFARYANVSDKI